jgi:hypothetical protein
MSSTITQQSILNKGRKDKFLLVLDLPDVLKKINILNSVDRNSNNVALDSLQYSVYGTVVPNITVNPVDLPYSGQTLNVTSGKREKYSDITVNFTVDNGFNNWWVLWKWLDYINGAKTSTMDSDNLMPTSYGPAGKPINNTLSNLQSYQTTINVYGLDEYNNNKIRFTYSKAFITSLTGMTYNYRDADQLESSFTFSFSQLNAELL